MHLDHAPDAAPLPLDPLRLPLQGSRLIEASAGTGKTWTIAALVLRLVLGHGRDNAENQGVEASDAGEREIPAALAPSQILVMSFTRAATRELAERIRARLVQAAEVFRGQADAPADDTLLTGLLAAYPEGEARDTAAWRLAAAAEGMDDAAVLTIDAWCQRMLREHAFDSGSLFDEELQADEAALRAQAARDYWRQQVLPLADAALDTVLAQWPDADAVAADVGPWLARWTDLQTTAQAPESEGQNLPLGQALDAAQQQYDKTLARLKAGWAARADAMQAWLDGQLARKPSPFNGRKLQARHTTAWFDALRAWALDPALAEPELSASARLRLQPDGLYEALAEGASGSALDWPPEFDAFAQLLQALADLQPPAALLRPHAATHLARRLAELKAGARRFGFADLQQRLADALDPARHGPRALRLRAQILAQFPAALVDEFQDTSPTQLAIFDRLYRLADTPPGLCLLLIGDPKQAIYSFRGADIASYLQARRATAGRHHVLGTNHRATHALVAAVNTLFGRAEARPGPGAFMYRGAHAGADGGSASTNELPFLPVAARGRPERFVHAGQPVPALQLCTLNHPLGNGDARPLLAELAAEQVLAWLNDPNTGFERPGQPLQRLRPADIAVLVRGAGEARALQRAFWHRQLPSVYLSARDSVFASAEAPDLLRLLQAMAAPRELRLARAAFGSGLLGFSLPELLQLASDEAALDALCAQLPVWQAVWQSQGVLAALRQALHALGLPARWLGQPQGGGERRLTNVLHLAELLQAQSQQLDGEHGLLRWLAAQVYEAEHGPPDADDARVLRLESDADLVQIVTIHKSKGLEYPVVLLPFAALPFSPPPSAAHQPLQRPGNGPDSPPQLVWQPDAEDREAAAQERLREDTRLLYVALTRARHALWLGVWPPKVGKSATLAWPQTALGRLLSGPAPITAEAWPPADLAALITVSMADTHIVQQPAVLDAQGRPPRHRLQPRGTPTPLAPAPRYQARFDRLWAIASYSQLVKNASGPATGGALAAVESTDTGDSSAPPLHWRNDEPAAAPEPPAPNVAAEATASAPWHRFPRGALSGNLLHNLLEWLADEGFALTPENDNLAQRLRQRCARLGWGHRADDLLAWLQRVCTTPLPPLGLALHALPLARAEMEFWLPIESFSAEAVDALCRQHILPGQPRPALPPRALHGLLMGFADLVFSVNAPAGEAADADADADADTVSYGVLDYKSNALGPGDADYHPAAMQAAVLAHRYDVQAALYLLALHRLLRQRLGARYRPEAQLRGAVFLFLRGIAGPAAGACAIATPPALLQALDDLLPSLPEPELLE